MNNTAPLISIVIVSWNSSSHLPACLISLHTQTFQNFEVVIVDNGSKDGSIDGLEIKWPGLNLKITRLEQNLGFAIANNIGARLARGKWLALLNADAFPEPNWLEQLIFAARKNPKFTFFSSRQIQFNHPDLLDGAGDEYHVSGLAWRRYYNHTQDEYGTEPEEVFSACAAAALYSREDFLRVEGFDKDYFSYFEDVDLSFRLRLIGGRCLYVPTAIIYHVGSASAGKMSDFVIYHGHRNLVWAYFKNMPALLFLAYLPLHVLMNVYFIFSFSLQGKWKAIITAKIDAIRGLPLMLNKRRVTQRLRNVAIADIYRVMNKDWLSPYWASRQRRLAINKNR
jgi:GT2 family glycosyltransferase